MENEFDEVQGIFIGVADDLLRMHGKPFSYDGTRRSFTRHDDRESVFATIGFGSRTCRGHLVIVARRATAYALRPDGIEDQGDTVLCDVLGELSNMLVGRLKNKLLSRGVVLLLGTPTSAIVQELRLQAPPDSERSAWHAFEIDGCALQIRFGASLDNDFVLDPMGDASPVLVEGDMMMF